MSKSRIKSEKRKTIIFLPMIQKSFNDLFGVIKNPKLKGAVKLKMLKAIMGEQARFSNAVKKYLSNLNLEPFSGEHKIKLSYVPFYGLETKKTKAGRKKPNKNPFDCVNYAPTMKVFEDRLVELEILPEDNYKIIPTNEICPAIVDRNFKGHGIFLIIEEIDTPENSLTDEMKNLLEEIEE